jgi:predicted nucleotidyltransferase
MLNDKSIKKQIKQVIKEADDSAQVILFGSRARGTAHADSDWDILILLNKPVVSIKEEQVFRHKLYDLELKIGIPISTFVSSLQDWGNKLLHSPLRQNIQREGMVL